MKMGITRQKCPDGLCLVIGMLTWSAAVVLCSGFIGALPQLDRGTDYESVRRGFESLTAHHRNCRPPRLLPRWLFCFHGLISSRGCYLGAKRRPSNPSFSEHCSRFRTLTGKNRVVCILFLLNAFRLPLSWQNPFEMYAFRLNDGKILAPCMHFQMQLGNSEYIA